MGEQLYIVIVKTHKIKITRDITNMFNKLKNSNVENIYQNIVQISRSKFFYVDLDLPDSFETRFDLIIFHSFIVFYYYKTLNDNISIISQNLFDLMFQDFENNLREMGFGDIAVNKKMKVFISAFYGRIAQYDRGMDKYSKESDKLLLKETILNNIYKGKIKNKVYLDLFVEYMLTNINHFNKNNEKTNIGNSYKFLDFKR